MTDNGLAKAVQQKFQSSMTEHYRSHLDGTNINKKSMLTTDYLNHFSGVLMLIEMLPTDPETFAEDVLDWSPLSYEEHCEVTGLRAKELAVQAYEHAPVDIRQAFDGVVDELNGTLVGLLDEIRSSMEQHKTDQLVEFCTQMTPQVRDLISQAADIVNEGTSNVVELSAAMDQDSSEVAQDEIDALFD